MHADVAQQVLLAPRTKQAMRTREFLRAGTVGLEVSLDVAADGGLVGAVWARVRLFPRVLAQVNLEAAVPVAAEETVRAGERLFSSVSANVVL